MHLTLIISSLKPGGAEKVISDLANYWVLHGQKVSLITFAAPSDIPFYPLDAGINLIQLNQSQQNLFFGWRLLNILKRLFLLRKTIKNLKPDVIVSFVDITNLTTILAGLGIQIPIIVCERTNPAYHFIAAFYNILRKYLYKLPHSVVVQTLSSANYFQGLINVKIIPNMVKRIETQPKRITQKVQKIISVGRLCPFKGFDTLIHAFSKVLKTHPDLTLTIYGEGAERQNLETLIQDLNLKGKVHLPGITTAVEDALLDGDMFVFPSLYEGFPNALCEAMAVGLPVIASDCSGNVDIVREGVDGRLFPKGDHSKLANIMLELIHDQAQRTHLSKGALEITQRFHPDHIFHQWDQLVLQATQS